MLIVDQPLYIHTHDETQTQNILWQISGNDEPDFRLYSQSAQLLEE